MNYEEIVLDCTHPAYQGSPNSHNKTLHWAVFLHDGVAMVTVYIMLGKAGITWYDLIRISFKV